MQVSDLMETELVVASPEMSLKEVDELFTLHGISGAPVVDDRRIVGVVSQSDVVRVLFDEQVAATEVSQFFSSPYPIPLPSVAVIARDRTRILDRIVEMKVADVMTSLPVVVGPHDDVRDAAQKMLDARVHRLLVVDDHGLVGVLSALDLVGLVATDM